MRGVRSILVPGLGALLVGLALTGPLASAETETSSARDSAPQAAPPGNGLQDARVPATAAQVALERRRVRTQLRAAGRVLRTSQRSLAVRLHALYLRESPEPLDVLLGSRSLDNALNGLDRLERAAGHDRLLAQQARAAQVQARRLERTLALREAELLALEQARAFARAQAARDERLAAESSQPARTTVRRVAARRAASRPAPSPAARLRVLTVVAYGYAITGNTASGRPAGPGTVAVDPGVIPLGTSLTIPGYGAGVAADTGGAIRGATIDLWFPTEAAARAWGVRTVTIVLGG